MCKRHRVRRLHLSEGMISLLTALLIWPVTPPAYSAEIRFCKDIRTATAETGVSGGVAIAAGASLGAVAGFQAARRKPYDFYQIREALWKDQAGVNELYGAIDRLYGSGEKLRGAYHEYYRYYDDQHLNTLSNERVPVAQNAFLENLQGFFRILKGLELPAGSAEAAALVNSYRVRTSLHMVQVLRAVLQEMHAPYLNGPAYAELSKAYLVSLNERMGDLEKRFIDSSNCYHLLSNPTDDRRSGRSRRFLFAGGGAASGAAAGWGLTRALDSALPLIVAGLCGDNAAVAMPSAPPPPPRPWRTPPPNPPPVPRGHELDRP